MAKFITLALSLFLLLGCSNNIEQKTRYYLLDSPSASLSATQPSTSAHLVDSAKVNLYIHPLPNYLQQANLVMQLSDHQLHYSHFHMWAQPLETAVKKALIKDLKASNNAVAIHLQTLNNKQTEIAVSIEYFHINQHGQALLTGVLHNVTAKQHLPFHFQAKLNESGYAHGVQQLRKVLAKLSKMIHSQIRNQR